MSTPTPSPTRCPLPPGVEIYLANDDRNHWRGELRDGKRTVEALGPDPESVVSYLVRLYLKGGETPQFA
jgi:hypothetical protein